MNQGLTDLNSNMEYWSRVNPLVLLLRIGTDFSFDDGMAYYGCQVFSFDPTTGKEDHQHSERVQFFNTGLADHDQEGNGKAAVDPPPSEWKTRTLASVMKDLNHREVKQHIQ